MKKIAIVPILCFAFFTAGFAQERTFDESVLSEKGRRAYRDLLHIQLFALGGIGYGGRTSEGEKAFDILIEEKEAVSAFRNLIDKATIEGAFYGLFGLKMSDCSCYREEVINFKKNRISTDNNEKFSTQSGCETFESAKGEDKEWFFNGIEAKHFFENHAAYKKRLIEQRKAEKKIKSN